MRALCALLLLTIPLPSLWFTLYRTSCEESNFCNTFHSAPSSAFLFRGGFHANEGIFTDNCYFIILSLCPHTHRWPFIWGAQSMHKKRERAELFMMLSHILSLLRNFQIQQQLILFIKGCMFCWWTCFVICNDVNQSSRIVALLVRFKSSISNVCILYTKMVIALKHAPFWWDRKIIVTCLGHRETILLAQQSLWVEEGL